MINNEPLVSVIIPAYQSDKTLSKCLESVIQQYYQNLEIIVVNNGSTDNTQNVIEEFSRRDRRVSYILLTENIKPAGGRNAGLLKTTGEYIAFLDADDEWLPGKIQTEIDFFRAHEDAKFIFTNATVITENCENNRLFTPSSYLSNKSLRQLSPDFYCLVNSREAIISYNPICLSTVLVCKSVLNRVDGFDCECHLSEDLDFWIRVAKYCDFYFINKITVNRCINSSSITKNQDEYNQKILEYYLAKMNDPKFIDLSEQMQKVIRTLYKKKIIREAQTWHPFKAISTYDESKKHGIRGLFIYAAMSVFGPIPIYFKREIINSFRKTKDHEYMFDL